MNAPIIGGLVVALLRGRAAHAARMASRSLIAVAPLGDARIQIPAVVVEPRGVGDCPDLAQRLAIDLPKADDDVGDLHAEIVDVVLDFDRRVGEPEDARASVSPSVAFRRWPMCAALFGLIAVCSTIVFSARCAVGPRAERRDLAAQSGEEETRGGRGKGSDTRSARPRLRDARQVGQNASQLLRDRARRLRSVRAELKRDRDGEIAQRAIGWNLDREHRDLREPVLPGHRSGDLIVNLFENVENHECVCRRVTPEDGTGSADTVVLGLNFLCLDRPVLERCVEVGEKMSGSPNAASA